MWSSHNPSRNILYIQKESNQIKKNQIKVIYTCITLNYLLLLCSIDLGIYGKKGYLDVEGGLDILFEEAVGIDIIWTFTDFVTADE